MAKRYTHPGAELIEDTELMDLDTNGSHYKCVSCFAQLCINDSIKECKSLKNPLSKAMIVSHFQKSTLETERMESMFGKVLLAKNETRWNSQLVWLMELDGTQDINNVIDKKILLYQRVIMYFYTS